MRYSISDDSIRRFAEKLNCVEGLTIKLEGRIVELNHQDYKGKRIFLSITDAEGTSISLKMDLGVHNDLSIEQDEYVFDIDFQEDTVSLLINSPAQMITEKLKSMVRFGARSTRYKDVYDIFYLSGRVNMVQLKECIQRYIFDDITLRNVTDMKAIVTRVERMFNNPSYFRELHKSDKNWLDISDDEILKADLAFIKGIAF
ncbi:MAG: nucleotidyl transferase AbiEii/AbiGii toxin family protein [Clostridia bacterium]|nr:nucleotidyl transferase AbiEii/AbiGii toxin family protein [Clostridia bacterium]